MRYKVLYILLYQCKLLLYNNIIIIRDKKKDIQLQQAGKKQSHE
jgi:hypothetical protein